MNNNLLWVVGGHDGFSELSTTEFITLDQLPKPGPNLPFSISWHSMIQYDSNSIYIIGGKQDCTNSKKTWIVNVNDLNIKNFKIQEGSMHKLRYVEKNCSLTSLVPPHSECHKIMSEFYGQKSN